MWSNLVSNPRRGLRLLGLFLLTLGMGALALPSLGKMGSVSIIDLQFMRTSENAAEQIARLGPAGVDAAQMAHYLDFPLLVLYGIALSAACVVMAARAADRGKAGVASLGRKAAWLGPIAAALDAIEDVAILVVLGGHTGQPWPAIAYVSAAVKFLLLAVVIAYLVVGFLSLGRKVPVEASPAE